MITRSQSGIVKPIDRLSLHTFSISPILNNPSHALKDPNWRNAMYDEYNALVKNGTWLLVPSPAGVDFDETFSPVIKPATIHTVLSLVVSRQWPIHQLAVKNAFLNGDLSETVYMHQPPGFVDNRQGSLNNEFDMTDLGGLNYFLGISADRTPTGLFLSQEKYALQLLERAHMVTYNLSRTPVDIESKLDPEGAPVQDPTLYRSLAGGL
ncbi:ribonuclease H-like domain-containing protein [Tanacetum coccineum]